MGKHHRMLPVFPTAVATLAFGVAAPPAGAAGNDENEVVIPFGGNGIRFRSGERGSCGRDGVRH